VPSNSSKKLRPSNSQQDLQERIRNRAEEIYVRNGRIPGRDLENWSQAEQEIQAEMNQTRRRTAIVVRVKGVQYVGEYQIEFAEGYEPGEFGPGDAVPVRIEGDRMLVQRPNGKVLETKIVQEIG
jgi:Protein of unknown function (DUF2934)